MSEQEEPRWLAEANAVIAAVLRIVGFFSGIALAGYDAIGMRGDSVEVRLMVLLVAVSFASFAGTAIGATLAELIRASRGGGDG